MGGEPECASDKEETVVAPPSMVGPLSSVRLSDAPILFFVLNHNAMRLELAELRRVVVEASESGSHGSDLVLDLHRRLEFLKHVYKYHCAAEDEVIFLALDVHIKNVVSAYSLEHKSIDGLFESIFNCLNALTKGDENTSELFQELSFCIGTTETTICQHMRKEEKQVFPLLMQQLSSKEQTSLVWKFICSVPIMFLADFLPWMTSFLSPVEQLDAIHCIKEVVPKEKLLQEVVISWMDSRKQSSLGIYNKCGKANKFPGGLADSKEILEVYKSKGISGEERQSKIAYDICSTGIHNPVDGVHLWHDAIRTDLKEILEELYQMRSSNSFSTIASVIVQIKFFIDVLIFYSNALDKVFYPVWNELAKDCLSPSYERFREESHIEGLQRFLSCNSQNETPLSNFAEKLCGELELFVAGISKHMAFLETEVFPFISKNCSHGMQQWLLYTGLLMMPLGLLKCVITWFSAHLSEEASKSIVYSIKQGGTLANKSFQSLLYEWIRNGYLGKTSVEKFRKDLQEMFNNKSTSLSDQSKDDAEFSYLPYMQPCNRYDPGPLEQKSAMKTNNYVSNFSFCCSNMTEKYDTSYSSRINFPIFFPQTSKILTTLSKFPAKDSGASSSFNPESSPMDHIFFFHKALKKDLEYLVSVSSKLTENDGLFADFRRRFHLVQFLYKFHSDAEDEIAFPALETKGEVQNISHSYTIDHKLEVEHFNKISLILDEISKFHVPLCSDDVHALGQRMLNYRRLCVILHDMCKSMYKILSDHLHHEEIELLPLFREWFSIKEQEEIVGRMLGRTRAEILKKMIPWLMASLTPEEQHSMMSLFLKATRNTMFDEWLGEWWEGMNKYPVAKVEESNICSSWSLNPLELVSTYLLKEGFDDQGRILGNKGAQFSEKDSAASNIDLSGNLSADENAKALNSKQINHQYSDCTQFSSEVDKKRCNDSGDLTVEVDDPGHVGQVCQKYRHPENILILSQEELEAAIRRVSCDSTLDAQKKSFIIQNLLISRWIVSQQKPHPEITASSNKEEVPGQCPSYRNPLKLAFGCKHYKRNCKLVAACCNRLYVCRQCHDEVADHSMDRKATVEMMCMKCLIIQPISPTCSTVSCNNLPMARYYCRICKFFDDEREIYHCPYCNLCRVGKGLGIDYFHCMNCNACMSRSLSVHMCREKCLEENCPICHEYIFTSTSPVKALPCGHLMHSACFQDYTCIHYTCPICSKSLGDMQVYFGMLDALLAEEKIPDEYSGQTQIILCNDCEKRGSSSFHWLYHKCSYCGSYNTRLL